MGAGFLCPKCDNFACLQDQNELHLKTWFFFYKIGIFCKSLRKIFRFLEKLFHGRFILTCWAEIAEEIFFFFRFGFAAWRGIRTRALCLINTLPTRLLWPYNMTAIDFSISIYFLSPINHLSYIPNTMRFMSRRHRLSVGPKTKIRDRKHLATLIQKVLEDLRQNFITSLLLCNVLGNSVIVCTFF